MSSRPALRPSVLLWILTAELWGIAVLAWVVHISDQFGDHRFKSWLLDWHVYAAGASDLLARTLYHVPLTSRFPIPVESFNYPPLAAAMAAPFLALPDSLAGTLWVLLNAASNAAAAVIGMHIVRVRHPWLWAGVIFAAYSVFTWSIAGLLGNNSPMILLLVAAFVAVHLANRPVGAGVLLGIAIATKLWPATFLVVLARERDWRTIGWALGVAALVTIPLLLWLGGPSVIGPLIAALQVRDEVNQKQLVIGITWLRENVSWWPEWGGYAVAFLILLIPARGMTGYGLATLAGMAAIPNLWRHYWGTVIFGLALLGRGLVDRFRSPADMTPPADLTVGPPVGDPQTDAELGT